MCRLRAVNIDESENNPVEVIEIVKVRITFYLLVKLTKTVKMKILGTLFY